MGEFQKRIGDIGEDIVADFLKLIGWNSLIRGVDIPSTDIEKHEKKSHGIDGYFHYKSPMLSRAIENVLISVKFSKDKYPNNPVPKFKGYYSDLAMGIESFKNSDLKHSTNSLHTNFEHVFDRGIIFWINNVESDSVGILNKLQKLEAPKDFSHDGIFLVDNKKMEFFFKSIEFVKNSHPKGNVEFCYFNSGYNGDDYSLKNGSIMPIQYLASGILPLKVEMENNQNSLVICSEEKFEIAELNKLIGLVKNITTNFQANTLIAFPDYNRLEHEQQVEGAKQAFDDPSFTNALSIVNYNASLRA